MPNERHRVRLRDIESECKCFTTSEGGENDPFAKPLYGLTPVPRVRIPPSPHTVWAAEKFGCIPPRFAENRRNSANPSVKPDRRKCRSRLSSVFLRRPLAQSGFDDSIRRTHGDQQSMIRRKRLDFVSTGSDTKVLICSADQLF